MTYTYPRSGWVAFVIEKDTGVVVESDVSPIRPPRLFLCSDDDGMSYISPSDLGSTLRCSRWTGRYDVGYSPSLVDDNNDLVTCRTEGEGSASDQRWHERIAPAQFTDLYLQNPAQIQPIMCQSIQPISKRSSSTCHPMMKLTLSTLITSASIAPELSMTLMTLFSPSMSEVGKELWYS